MKSERQMRLFMVNHPKPFERYEDHAEALHIQLWEMIEKSKNEGDNPLGLIETYLDIHHRYGQTPEELARIIMFSPQMQHALHQLQDNWSQFDKHLPEDSLMYGGVSKETARYVFTEISLHTYLEALSSVYSDPSN